ncbi:MAG: D-xylose ABC transporter ATP-binding protein, partial [Rhizobiaceae bacterium]|nr:D-xylose ABC transporter ATP-binding protein [Rhizobiaceae bacterium]
LFELADRGTALVVVSSEIEEVLGLADRVLVMRRGRLVLDAPRSGLTPHAVMQAAFGTGEGKGNAA